MKTKDLIALGLLAIVLLVVGWLLIGQLGGGDKQRTAEIEIVEPIDPQFNTEAKEILLDRNEEVPVESFSLPINLQQGLGNTGPFRPEP